MTSTGVIQSFRQANEMTLSTTISNTDVEGAGDTFIHPRGTIEIVVIDLTTSYEFSFKVEGSCKTIDMLSPKNYFIVPGFNKGIATATLTDVNEITITTPAADSGGRTYVFTFNIIFNNPCTIQKTAGGALGGNIRVDVNFIRLGERYL